MKKILLFAFAAVAALSCSVDSMNDVWNGSDRGGNRPGEAYMRQITEYLLVDNLQELEQAIYLDSLGRASDRHYAKTGASIRTVGSKWVLRDSERSLAGLEISMTADSTWQLKRNDKYRFPDEKSSNYRTDYTITAKQQPDNLGRSRGHCAWRLTVAATRYEDLGYKAEFSTQPDFLYKGGKLGWWTYCKGLMRMDVTRNGTYVDRCTIEYDGRKSGYIYIRGL
ncbi:MAG: hypothetical protein J5771_03960 [Bacteroidales bacterium]|nr:hypothetical protein [Bacteroidales bacterium]